MRRNYGRRRLRWRANRFGMERLDLKELIERELVQRDDLSPRHLDCEASAHR
jgi:hypothetical protein